MHLASVRLWGKENTMPGIPDENVPGDLIAEGAALIFRASRRNFALSIPLELVKEVSIYSERGGVNAIASNLVMLGLWPADEMFVIVTYYSAEDDMDITVWFYVGNTGNGPLKIKNQAIALAKDIKTQRSRVLESIRKATVITYR